MVSLSARGTDPRVLVCSSVDDMAFDVSWFAVHSFGLDKAPVLLSSLDRKGIVHTAPRDRKSDLSLERVGELEFLLQVHGSEDQDFGNYYCSVTPWVKSPIGSWQKEAEIFSKPVFITVKMDGKNGGQTLLSGLRGCLLSVQCAAADSSPVPPWEACACCMACCVSSPGRDRARAALVCVSCTGGTVEK